MTSRAFGVLDWIVLATYAVIPLGIGFHFSRRQRSTEEYFVGGRNMRPFLAGISIFTATTSVIAYIANPGEYIQFGPLNAVLANIYAMPLVYFVVGWFVIPVIMRLPITSAYELLEARLGRRVRQAGSLGYIISRLVWMALILYTSSTVLVRVLGCDPGWSYLITVITGAITTTYTLFGGIRTVMITEVMQFFVLLVGAAITVISISFRLGGVSSWLPTRWDPAWPPQPLFSLDPHVRSTVIGAVISSIIGMICSASSDQASIQRLLTTRDVRAARRAYLLSNVALAVVSVALGLVGAALLGFYRARPEAIPDHLTLAGNGDAFFPLYISHQLPTGISGLLVASMLSAAMSCLAAGINGTITVASKDFVETSPRHAGRSEREKVRLTRFLALGFGLVVIVSTLGISSVRGNLVEVAGKTLSLLTCPLFGLFFLAIFVKFSTPFGAIMSAVYGATAAVVVGYWDAITGQPRLSFLLIMPVSLVATLGAGCLFSLWPTRGRSAVALGACGTAALAPLAAIVVWIAR